MNVVRENAYFGHMLCCRYKRHFIRFARMLKLYNVNVYEKIIHIKLRFLFSGNRGIHKYAYSDSIMNMHIKLYTHTETTCQRPKEVERWWWWWWWWRGCGGGKQQGENIFLYIRKKEEEETHPNQFIVLRLYQNDNISQDNNPCNMFYGTYNNEESFRVINKINIFLFMLVASFGYPLDMPLCLCVM